MLAQSLQVGMAVPGTISVDRFDVEAYANVQHLVSHITALLRPDESGASALQAVFPGGSITGCPRTMVCAVIDRLEEMPRSFWTGSIGYIDVHSGQSAWNILIRTLEAHRQGGRWNASVGAGGGITIASQPKNEVEEAAWKGAALRVAAGWMKEEQTSLPTGDLAIHPLQPPLRSHASSNTKQSVFQLFASMDLDNSGKIDSREFLAALESSKFDGSSSCVGSSRPSASNFSRRS